MIKGSGRISTTCLDLRVGFYTMKIYMSTEFDWFMVTMPIFAIVVYAIVMVGSMEKQTKFLESKQTESMVIWAFGALFALGAIYAGWSMGVSFWHLVTNY